MWKILNAPIRKEICYSLQCHRLFPTERKGCRKVTRETYCLQYADQCIFKQVKTREKQVAMALIDEKQANLDKWMSENVQNIQQSHRLYHETNGKLESGISSRRTNSHSGKHLKWHNRGRLILASVICFSNDMTFIYLVNAQRIKITVKGKQLYIYIYIYIYIYEDIKIFARN